jgi:hypothetical protein
LESEFLFDNFSTAEFKIKSNQNLRNQKRNRSSASNEGPRNRSQKYPNSQPSKVAPIQYCARFQRVEVNTTQPLTPKEIKCIQDVIGTLLTYARAVDPTLLAALSAIAARQSNGTWAMADACHQLLDYVATHPDAGIQYKACNMILLVHTDVSYLSKPGGKSRAAGYFYLSNCNDKDFNNGAILTLSIIIKHDMSSASKAELAALYYCCKFAAPL